MPALALLAYIYHICEATVVEATVVEATAVEATAVDYSDPNLCSRGTRKTKRVRPADEPDDNEQCEECSNEEYSKRYRYGILSPRATVYG